MTNAKSRVAPLAYIRVILAALIATAVALCTGLATASAVSEQEGAPETVPALLTLFDAQAIPADYALVVDISTSMEDDPPRPWQATREAVGQFVDMLGPNDNLTLVLFNKQATIAWRGPVPDAQAKAEAAAKLPRSLADLPKPIKSQDGTDIGKGLQVALDALDRPGAPEIETVVLLTDGKLNTAPDSPYRNPGSAGWAQLRQKAQNIAQTRSLQGIALGLTAGTDAGLLDKVVVGTTTVALPPAQLKAYFTDTIAKSQLRAIQPLVSQDLGRPVNARLEVEGDPGAEMDAHIEVTSTREELTTDVQIRNLTITRSDGSQVAASYSHDPTAVGPGGTASIPVHLSGVADDRGIQLGRTTEDLGLTTQIDATAVAASSPLLVREKVATPEQVATKIVDQGTGTLSVTYGIPWWLIILVLAILIIIVALLTRWNMLPPLVGKLEVVVEPETAVQLSGHTVALPSASSKYEQLARWDVGSDKVLFFTRRRHRGSVYVRLTDGQPQLDKKGNGSLKLISSLDAGSKLSPRDVVSLGALRLKYRRSGDT